MTQFNVQVWDKRTEPKRFYLRVRRAKKLGWTEGTHAGLQIAIRVDADLEVHGRVKFDAKGGSAWIECEDYDQLTQDLSARGLTEGAAIVTGLDPEGSKRGLLVFAAASGASRAPARRSAEMMLVAFYLSKHASPLETRFGTNTWSEVYAGFHRSLAEGRTLEAFSNSLKNARDLFDAHVESSGRVGWRDHTSASAANEVRPPASLSAEARKIMDVWDGASEEDLWAEIERYWAPSGDARVRERDEASTSPASSAQLGLVEAPADPEERVIAEIRVRRGQGRMREKLLAVYSRQCAVSGHGPAQVLQAAHIDSHAVTGCNGSVNGLLLRSDLHDLFDVGLLRVDPSNLTIWIADSLHGTPYGDFHGKPLKSRLDGLRPDLAALQRRWRAPQPHSDIS